MLRERNHYNPVDIGHNIAISHRDYCPHWPGRTIHIWRSDMPENSCEFVSLQQFVLYPDRHLTVHYKDGESLLAMNVSIDEIAQFSRGEKPLLIHCTVGQTRSPTLALIAKVVRGVSVYQAMADIMRANWETRAVISNFCLTPLRDILMWAERPTS